MNAATQTKSAVFGRVETVVHAAPIWMVSHYNGKTLVTGADWTIEQCLAEAITALEIVEYVYDHEDMRAYWEVDGTEYATADEAWDALVSITDPDGEYTEITAIDHAAAKEAA